MVGRGTAVRSALEAVAEGELEELVAGKDTGIGQGKLEGVEVVEGVGMGLAEAGDVAARHVLQEAAIKGQHIVIPAWL